jgi:hypothetical protein
MKNGDIVVFFYPISRLFSKISDSCLMARLERLSALSGAESKSEHGITSLGDFL